MKSLVLTLLILVAALSCAAQPREPRRLGFESMWGPVRSVRTEKAVMINRNGEWVEGARVLLQTINYNEEGTQRETVRYNADGTVSFRQVEVYDPDGRILEIDGGIDNGRRAEYKYDSLKRLIETVMYRPDKSVYGRVTYTYEGNLRFHESIGYDPNGVVISRVTGKLDMTTHQMETVSQTPDQTVQRQAGFTNTPNGQIYEAKVNGTPVARTLTSSTKEGGAEITEFNPDGTVLQKSLNRSETDSHGNVTKSTSFRQISGGNFQPTEVFYRTFEYYESKTPAR